MYAHDAEACLLQILGTQISCLLSIAEDNGCLVSKITVLGLLDHLECVDQWGVPLSNGMNM
jgi:hypothetical protein